MRGVDESFEGLTRNGAKRNAGSPTLLLCTRWVFHRVMRHEEVSSSRCSGEWPNLSCDLWALADDACAGIVEPRDLEFCSEQRCPVSHRT